MSAVAGVVRLPLRLTRRGALLMCLTGAAYMLIEVSSYEGTYPDEASRARLAELSENAAVRTLQGVPHAVETVGGYVVWDTGWFLATMTGIWVLLMTTRLTRAEEDSGRGELVLSRPVRPVRLLVVQLAVVAAQLTALGAAVAAALVAQGLDVRGAVLFGAALAGLGLTVAGVAALSAQLLDVRRRAVAASAAFLGLSFVLRMYASSADGREWLLVATPYGWMDRVQPYAANRWTALLPFLGAFALLSAAAVRERARRDLGAARLTGHEGRRARLRLLGGPVAFGWRATSGVLLAWTVSVALFGAVMGSIVSAFVEFVEDDEQYAELLAQLGVDLSDPVQGFLSFMAVSMALVFALFVSWRIGALRTEEATGRLEHLLVRPVSRWRWLGGSALLAVAASLLVVAAAAVGLWVGAWLTGGGVGFVDAFGPLLATVPVVVLFCGLAVLAFGGAPRSTVALPVASAVVLYLLELIQTVLDLPERVLDLSPFRWLPQPPAEPWSAGPAAVLVLLGVAAAVGGVVLFSRRDLTTD